MPFTEREWRRIEHNARMMRLRAGIEHARGAIARVARIKSQAAQILDGSHRRIQASREKTASAVDTVSAARRKP
jgi:hypothetical protein